MIKRFGWISMTLLHKNITLFILLGVKASVVWDWQTDKRRRIQTSILTQKFFSSCSYQSVISSRPHLALLLLDLGSTQSEDCWGSNGTPSHSLALPWLTALFWRQAETDSRLTQPVLHVGIWIHHFITPTHFRSTTWLLLLIFTGAPGAENLWLMARSNVKI